MAQTLKVLGQEAPAAATLTPLVTAGAAEQISVSSVVVCNRDAAATTFRLSIAIAGAADSVAQRLYPDLPVDANDTFVCTIGITMAPTDVLRCQSANGLVSFNAFGAVKT